MINNRQGGRRRGRGGGGGGPPRSNNPGPGNRQDNRQRGNAAQLLEKYKGLARDAQMQGDRVQTEYYLQYADHYFRVLNENRARFEEQRPRQRDDYEDEDEDQDGDAGRDAPSATCPTARRRSRRAETARAPPSASRARRATTATIATASSAPRRPRAPAAPEVEEDGDDERIALDVLPPAISAANESGRRAGPGAARPPPPPPARPGRGHRPGRLKSVHFVQITVIPA